MVKLHYDEVGTIDELNDPLRQPADPGSNLGAVFPTFSSAVPSITVNVSRGVGEGSDRWIIAYETETGSLVGLRARPDGAFREVEDHTDIGDQNRGRGNGMVMSVVMSGVRMREELGPTEGVPLPNQPIVTRLFDLGFDAVSQKHHLLVFFEAALSTTTSRAVTGTSLPPW